jgi:hypothetical protein
MQHITLDYLYEEIDRHRKALKEIHEHCGRVCEEYEICTHVACSSSHRAWEIADKVLRKRR